MHSTICVHNLVYILGKRSLSSVTRSLVEEEMVVLFALLVAISTITSIATNPATNDEIKDAQHLITHSLSPLARPLPLPESVFDFGQV